jgi:hypothetical protein
MNHLYTGSYVRSLAAAAMALTALHAGPVAAQGPAAVEERVAVLKKSIGEGQARLRKYEWIETTIVSVKGEEKDRKQQSCYYGADGKIQKVLLSEQKAAPPSGGRLKKKIVANKTADMKEYMEAAATLIHRYVPPNPADIDGAKQRSKVVLRPSPNGLVRLEFTDYLKPGDLMTVDVDPTKNALVGLSVKTYVEKPEEPVTLTVAFGALPDGASFTSQTTLDATAKNIIVVIQNSGHRAAATR